MNNIWVEYNTSTFRNYISLNQVREVIISRERNDRAQVVFVNGETKDIIGTDNVQTLQDALFQAYHYQQIPG